MSRRCVAWMISLGLAWTLLVAKPAWAHDSTLPAAQIMGAIGFDQRLNAAAPSEAAFVDDQGQRITLGELWGHQPVILVMGYFSCSSLCPLVRQRLATAFRGLPFTAGQEFLVVAISIDPTNQPADAAAAKTQALAVYDRPGAAAGWRFLVGDHSAIDQLAEAIGLRYAYDARQGEYAHASGLVILTPEGKVARYLLGLDYPPRTLRLALVEAANHQIGTVVDQVLLFCYHYDPISGQYNLLVMKLIRSAGLMTVLMGALWLWWSIRRASRSNVSPL